MELRFFEKKIGVLVVYPEQVETSHRILQEFKNQSGPPLLIAQPQQGKTGCIICTIKEFIEDCESQSVSYEVVYLINIQDNDLKNQTKKRITQAGLKSKVQVLHLADLKKSIQLKKVDCRLIIMDECHEALGKDKLVHKFLRNCGILYGEPISAWPNKSNYVLSVSATPYAAVIQSHLNEKAFSRIILPVSESYFTLQNMAEKKRFRQSQAMVKQGTTTEWFQGIVDEFVSTCEVKGNGYLIVRAKDIAPEVIQQFIEAKYGDEVDVEEFSDKKKNISLLDDTLCEEPAKPFIAIIRGSLRAGKTLSTTRYIRGWIEPQKSKGSTICQVIGRCLGYSATDGHSKYEDDFIVYCDTREIEDIIKFYNNNQESVPSGPWNGSNAIPQKERMIIVDSEADIPFEYLCNPLRVSTQNKQNLALSILNSLDRNCLGGRRSSDHNGYYIDGPNHSSPENEAAWRELAARYPDVIGKWAYHVPLEDKERYQTREAQLRPNVLFASAKKKALKC